MCRQHHSLSHAPHFPLPLAGESNALNAEAAYYDCALPALIDSWRAALGANPAAWWGIAQLAPWASSAPADNIMVADLRASQLKVRAARVNVTVATAVDGGDPFAPIGSIHPRTKQPLGRRLAAGALNAMFTGLATLPASTGPLYASAVSGGGPPGAALSATITFDPATLGGAPLVMVAPNPIGPLANSSVCPAAGVDPGLCAGFQLQDSTGVWWDAAASVTPDGARLVLFNASAPSGTVLNATSNGYSLWPITLLYNAAGVPAFPWRAGV